jgi:hypothetical protein
MAYRYEVIIDAPTYDEAERAMSALLSAHYEYLEYRVMGYHEIDLSNELAEAEQQAYQEALIDERD